MDISLSLSLNKMESQAAAAEELDMHGAQP